MPFKPKAGEIYLFKAKSQKEMNNWRAIGHRFYQARGGKWICGGLIQRRTFNIVTPTSGKAGVTDFQMFSWTHRDDPLTTLVQFVGDHTVSVDFPHKNSKKGIPYIRSAPSVLRGRRESSGDMIGCDNLECETEWFHFSCLDLSSAPVLSKL